MSSIKREAAVHGGDKNTACCMCAYGEPFLFLRPFDTDDNSCPECLCIYALLLERPFLRPESWDDAIYNSVLCAIADVSRRPDLGMRENIDIVIDATAAIYEDAIHLRSGLRMQRLAGVPLIARLIFGNLRRPSPLAGIRGGAK